MRRNGLRAFLALQVSLLLIAQTSGRGRFPPWQGGLKTLHGIWMDASHVVVGDVANVEAYGEQAVDQFPWPTQRGLHRLYWCQADLRITAIVKGQAPLARSKVLWGAVQPGCRLDYGDSNASARHLTKVWFIKVDDEFSTLLSASFHSTYLGLPYEWDKASHVPAKERLGIMLLDPPANPKSRDSSWEIKWDIWNVACELLGKADCVRRMKELAQQVDSPLRAAVCEYLRAQHGEKCDP